ncbi:hypothetical protein L798_02207 [Zootermopsis nevadensis]|uniref:Uncharacterized protein n=1 Tax=Zootermopsis nevadensis TaxID=136037 RepID=A0A067QHJ3_ZOONE|nr:hypothetical protein L798_02207 [Zootermopsis nevadensis]
MAPPNETSRVQWIWKHWQTPHGMISGQSRYFCRTSRFSMTTLLVMMKTSLVLMLRALSLARLMTLSRSEQESATF